MMHRFKPVFLLAPLAALLIAAAPTDPGNMPTREDRLAQAAALVDAGKPADALAILDALLAESDLPADKGQVEGLRSFALARSGKFAEARRAIEFAVDATMNPSLLLLRQLFVLRAITGDVPAAAQTLQLVAVTNPKWLGELPEELVFDVLRETKDEQQRFDLTLTLVIADFKPANETIGSADFLKLQAIEGLITRNRIEEARPLVDRLINPQILMRLGIDRRFEALWPTVEARLGPAADIADAAFVAAAKARFDAAPDNDLARLGYAEALNMASREREALAVADTARTTEAMAKLSNRGLWMVNLAGQLLADLGQGDDGLARFAAVAALDPKEFTELTGIMINHATLADELGRSAEALKLADVAETKVGSMMSDYGRLYLSAVRACANHRLGNAAAAATALAALAKDPAKNFTAHRRAMLCTGNNDAAARAIIQELEDPKLRALALFELQGFIIARHPELPGQPDKASLRALKARPDVKAAFLKWGRDLPAAVAPPR